MTQEDIIRMAHEVFDVQTDSRERTTFSGDSYAIERFAALVASAEREKFCVVLRQLHDSYSLTSDSNAIREKGQV